MGGSLGVSALNDTFEVGVDAQANLIGVGSGHITGGLGVYAKVIPIPLGFMRHLYVRGRTFMLYWKELERTETWRALGAGIEWETEPVQGDKNLNSQAYAGIDFNFVQGFDRKNPTEYAPFLPFLVGGFRY